MTVRRGQRARLLQAPQKRPADRLRWTGLFGWAAPAVILGGLAWHSAMQPIAGVATVIDGDTIIVDTQRVLASRGVTEPSDHQRRTMEAAVRKSFGNYAGKTVTNTDHHPTKWAVCEATRGTDFR